MGARPQSETFLEKLEGSRLPVAHPHKAVIFIVVVLDSRGGEREGEREGERRRERDEGPHGGPSGQVRIHGITWVLQWWPCIREEPTTFSFEARDGE